MNNESNCCFQNILKVIDVLQRNAEKREDVDNSCSRGFLGNFFIGDIYNTRPVTFYNRNGNILEINYTIDGVTSSSSIFRVENVDNCCCQVSILAPNPITTDPSRPYINTGKRATINLECICVLQCLPDVIIDNI